MAENAYNGLADWFEYLNDDCGYEEWSQYLLSVLEKNGAGRVGLDVGCGSGYFTRQLYKHGYAVTGVDISAPMLEKAVELSKKEGLSIPYLLGDVTALKVFERVDFVVAVNDCFNYVPPEKLLTAFKKVNSALKKGGIFFFDVSSERKLTTLPPVSIDDRENVTYFAFNGVENGKVTMDVTLYVKGRDGKYERKDETHTQYVHTEEAILSALDKAGFGVKRVCGHLEQDKNTADRIEILAVRK